MPIKLVPRQTIVNLEEVQHLFADKNIAIKYLECLNTNGSCVGKGEFHHIIPFCKSKDNSTNNIVFISLDNHYKCHYYLTFVKEKKLKKQMSFAFRQMTNTRKQVSPELLETFAKRFEHLVSERVFKNNYERTELIKQKVAKGVSDYLTKQKPKWVNNRYIEKFIPEDNLKEYLCCGFTLGRLKVDGIIPSHT